MWTFYSKNKTKHKTLWSLFSPVRLIYIFIYSRRSKRLLVWANRQSCHQLTNGERQSQITIQRSAAASKPRWRLSIPPCMQHSWTSTCALFSPSLKGWHKQHALHTYMQRTHATLRHMHTHTHTHRESKGSHSGTDTNAYICRNLKIA